MTVVHVWVTGILAEPALVYWSSSDSQDTTVRLWTTYTCSMSFGPEILDQAEAGLQLLHVRSLPAPIQSNSTSEQTVALDLGNSRLMTRIDGIIILDQNGYVSP